MGIYVAFGANLPAGPSPPAETIARAHIRLEQSAVPILRRSRLYRSRAWPDTHRPDYVNAVSEIATDRSPADLLALLHAIEAEFGRIRGELYGARTLDLDLLDYNGTVLDEGGLILPHPRMHERGFVLSPLAEIAPDWRHPRSRRAVNDLLASIGPGTEAVPIAT